MKTVCEKQNGEKTNREDAKGAMRKRIIVAPSVFHQAFLRVLSVFAVRFLFSKELFISLLVVSCNCVAVSQEIFSDRIKGLRVTGETLAGFPAVIEGSSPLLIEFDTNEDHPADFRIKYFHCKRNWEKTRTSFINDESRNTTRSPLSYEQSPVGVQHYRWHYSVQLPGHPDVKRFSHSGNYLFEIWDEAGKSLLARGHFFVAEKTIMPKMRVANRQLPSVENPLNKAHRVDVQFSIPEDVKRGSQSSTGNEMDVTPESQEMLFPILLSTVDVYKNRELYRNYRIDTNERTPETFVDGFGTRNVRFTVLNILPGNEYRRLNLRNFDHYPPGRLLRPRDGADVLRASFRTPRDHNGLSSVVKGDRYGDYLQIQFEYLDDAKRPEDSVYVVGDFNGWQTGPASLMKYDDDLKRFIVSMWLRRGEYDYQYVLNEDWISLEGNDWRTVNVYSAVVYYRDERYGGFDRILGFVQGRSAGQNEATE